MATNNCGKCETIIRRNKGNWMACDGFCSRMFHTECVSLTESDMMTFLGRNVLWFCDACLPKLWELKNREADNSAHPCQPAESHDANDSIKAEIARLNADIASINEQLQMVSRSHTHEGRMEVTPPAVGPGTMLTSTLLCGTKENSPTVSNCSTRSSPGSASHFWMYFTRIASFTTENDMRNLVRESLQYNGRISVQKLVPPWKDAAAMDYVSFKIEIANTLRNVAMDPSSWPKGLRFREFINVENNIWEPPMISP